MLENVFLIITSTISILFNTLGLCDFIDKFDAYPWRCSIFACPVLVLLLPGVVLDMFPQAAGVCVSFYAAIHFTSVGFLQITKK